MLGLVRQTMGDLYLVEREIGRGGAARVFLAKNQAGERVALKVLHPELSVSVTADRFLREISLLSKLEHPLIARLLDWGEREFLIYYAMSFVEGPSLRLHLDRARRATLSDTIHIGCDLLSALEVAHEQGIVHRDVKPENVILSRGGAILLDFGIARAVAASGTERLTRSGFTVGTSSYMSPEQILGADDIDQRSDIYSVGCVLFECLAGRPPFTDPMAQAIAQAQAAREAPAVQMFRADTPDLMAQALHQSLQHEPSARWQKAAAMREALLACTTGAAMA
ncbi:MAG TPA: serine/threonine-protein kinase [Gemmatimonadales bacterium]|nr:serine/threonine-protein kinase [Gemmatimonadales bacterium]